MSSLDIYPICEILSMFLRPGNLSSKQGFLSPHPWFLLLFYRRPAHAYNHSFFSSERQVGRKESAVQLASASLVRFARTRVVGRSLYVSREARNSSTNDIMVSESPIEISHGYPLFSLERSSHVGGAVPSEKWIFSPFILSTLLFILQNKKVSQACASWRQVVKHGQVEMRYKDSASLDQTKGKIIKNLILL